jgi:hypothetical protein
MKLISLISAVLTAAGLLAACASAPVLPEPSAAASGQSLLLVLSKRESSGTNTQVQLTLKNAADQADVRTLLLSPGMSIQLVDGLAPGTYYFANARSMSQPSEEAALAPERAFFTLKPGTLVVFSQTYRFSRQSTGLFTIDVPIGANDDSAKKESKPRLKPWRLVIPGTAEAHSDTSGGSSGGGDSSEVMTLAPVTELDERLVLESLRSQPAARRWKYEPIHPANAALAAEVFGGT